MVCEIVEQRGLFNHRFTLRKKSRHGSENGALFYESFSLFF